MSTVLTRFLFKKMVPGDIAKLKREGAVSGTGGGARDLRFRPWSAYEPIVKRMFPEAEANTGGRTIYTGTLRDGTGQVQFWSPTDARPGEGRLARVYSIPALAPDRLPDKGGPILMLLGQYSDGHLAATWVTAQALELEGWDPRVRDFLLEVLSKTPADKNAHGWMDLERGAAFSKPATTYQASVT